MNLPATTHAIVVSGWNVSAKQHRQPYRRTEAVEKRECQWQSPNAPINPKKHLVHGPILQGSLLVLGLSMGRVR